MRSGMFVLTLTLSGCLTAHRREPADEPGADAGVTGAPDDAAPVGGAPDATAFVSCAERLPADVVSVEDPATGHCYFLGSNVAVFDVAAEDCAAQGAHVVQLDQREAGLLAVTLLATDASWWIGLRHAEDPVVWKWVTGEELGPWDDWSDAQPSGDSECVELFTISGGVCADGCWNDLLCNDHTKAAICELEP